MSKKFVFLIVLIVFDCFNCFEKKSKQSKHSETFRDYSKHSNHFGVKKRLWLQWERDPGHFCVVPVFENNQNNQKQSKLQECLEGVKRKANKGLWLQPGLPFHSKKSEKEEKERDQ